MFSISCYHVFDLRRQTDFTNKSAKPEKKKKKSSKAIKTQSWSKLSLENKSYELGRRLLNFAVYWEKLPFCLICSLWLGSAPNRILNWIKNQNMATLRRFKHNKRRKWKSGKKVLSRDCFHLFDSWPIVNLFVKSYWTCKVFIEHLQTFWNGKPTQLTLLPSLLSLRDSKPLQCSSSFSWKLNIAATVPLHFKVYSMYSCPHS